MLNALLIILFSLAFSESDFNSNVNSYLENNLSNYEKLEFEIINIPKNISEIKIRESDYFEHKAGIVYVPVVIVKNDGTDYNSIIPVKIKLYEKVLTAVNTVERNSDLYPSDFEFKTIETSRVRGNLIKDYETLAKLRSKRTIKPGDLLLDYMVKERPAVSSGEKVKAILRAGSILISTEAFAREDGCAGEIIRIKTKGNKQFRAKVIDSKNVKIIE
jgi:flagella basal body P-ring formation protein FlgA